MSSPASAWWRNRSYLLLSGVMFASFLSSGLMQPLRSLRAQELGAALWEIGLIGMVGQVAGTIVQYLWGQQSDRVMRRKPLVLIGAAGSALAALLMALVSDYRPLYVIQAVGGLAMAAYGVGRLAMIGDILEGWPNRGRLMGLHRAAGSLAFGLAALFGGRLADLHGMTVPFALAAAFHGVAFLLSVGLRESLAAEDPSVAEGETTSRSALDRVTWAKMRQVLPFLAVVFIWFVSMGSAFEFWPVYMAEQGFTKTVTTRLWGVAALAETVAMVVAGYFCDRWGSRRVVAGGLAGMGLVFGAYTVLPHMPWLLGTQLVRALAFSAYSAASMLYATEMGLRRQRGRMAGLHATAASLGGISGSAVGGALAEGLGVEWMIRAVGMVMVLAGLVGGQAMAEPSFSEADAQARNIAPQARPRRWRVRP